MKAWKRVKQKWSRNTLKRGARGAISILLCLLLSPFVTVTLGLVEYARYQQVVELCDEVYELTGISILSDYDPYLHDRYGLLAINQSTDMSTVGVSLLEDNIEMLGNQVELDSLSVDGSLPLSNVDMLQQQVVDISELTASTAVLAKDLKLEDLLEQLAGMSGVEDFLNTVDSLAELSDAIREAVEKLEALKTAVDTLASGINEITTTATALASDMAEFYQKLLDEGIALPSDATVEEVTTALENFQSTYQEDYTNLLEMGKLLYNQLKALPDKLDAVKSAADEFKTAVEAARAAAEAVVSTNETDPDGSISQAATETLEDVLDEMEELVEDTLSDLTDGAIQAGKDAVNEIIDTVLEDTGLKDVVDRYQQIVDGSYFSSPMGDLAKQDLSEFLQSVYTVCQSHSEDALVDYFKSLLIPDIDINPGRLSEEIADILSNATGELINDGMERVAQLVDDLVKVVRELFNLNLFYDGRLDAFVNAAGDDSNGYQPFLTALGDLLQAAEDFGSSIASGGLRGMVGALKAMYDMFKAIGSTMRAVVGVVGRNLESIGGIVEDVAAGNTRELYERLLISGYMRHNLPCRLDAKYILDGVDGAPTGLTGFSFADIPQVTTTGRLESLTGGFTGLATFIQNMQQGYGSDKMFKAAQLEYIRAGTNSEVANQAIIFFDLYFLRLLLDLPSVFRDGEVRAVASAATIAAWAVYIIYVLVEPFCDTLLLVNGADVPFVKGKCWLVPSQLPEFISRIGEATLGGPLKTELESFMAQSGFGSDTSGGQNGEDTDYRTHMLVLLLIFVEPQDQIKRLQDLVEMEATVYYQEQGEAFQMTQTYTAVSLAAHADLNSLFDLGQASGMGPFRPSIELKQMISY